MSFDRSRCLSIACDVFRSLDGEAAARASSGRWRSWASAAGSSSSGVPLGSVQGQVSGVPLGGRDPLQPLQIAELFG